MAKWLPSDFAHFTFIHSTNTHFWVLLYTRNFLNKLPKNFAHTDRYILAEDTNKIKKLLSVQRLYIYMYICILRTCTHTYTCSTQILERELHWLYGQQQALPVPPFPCDQPAASRGHYWAKGPATEHSKGPLDSTPTGGTPGVLVGPGWRSAPEPRRVPPTPPLTDTDPRHTEAFLPTDAFSSSGALSNNPQGRLPKEESEELTPGECVKYASNKERKIILRCSHWVSVDTNEGRKVTLLTKPQCSKI